MPSLLQIRFNKFFFFLTGKAGQGKTHVLEGLIAYGHGHGQLPFIVTSTALAASNYEQACTSHSGFFIPVINDGGDSILQCIKGLLLSCAP